MCLVDNFIHLCYDINTALKKQIFNNWGVTMNLKLLNEKIDEISIPVSTIALKMGISRQMLYSKLNGERAFKMSEANKISEILRLTNRERTDIFFEASVDTFVH